jgi:hypothetical protein
MTTVQTGTVVTFVDPDTLPEDFDRFAIERAIREGEKRGVKVIPFMWEGLCRYAEVGPDLELYDASKKVGTRIRWRNTG